jgi:hypothetical protein
LRLQKEKFCALPWLNARGAIAALKAVLLRGCEVVFVVIAVGAGGGLLLPAGLGALAACVLVVLLGVAAHRPLSRIRASGLKFAVGVMLSALGVFWAGDGLETAWGDRDLTPVFLAVPFLAAGAMAPTFVQSSRWQRRQSHEAGRRARPDAAVFPGGGTLTFSILLLLIGAAAWIDFVGVRLLSAAPPWPLPSRCC